MMDERLEEIRKRCAAATAGPCSVRALIDPEAWQVIELGNNHWISEYRACDKADADFDAHARTDIPELLAEVDQLKAENARLRRVCTEASITISQVSPSASITVKESDRLDRASALLRTAARGAKSE